MNPKIRKAFAAMGEMLCEVARCPTEHESVSPPAEIGDSELLQIAKLQEALLWLIVISVVATFVPRSFWAIALLRATFIYLLARTLRIRRAWLYALSGCIHIIGVVMLFNVSEKAARIMRARGIYVGLMGARLSDLPPQEGVSPGQAVSVKTLLLRYLRPAFSVLLALCILTVFVVTSLHRSDPKNMSLSDLRNRANSGNAPAETELANRYSDGKGVARDFAQALAWYQKAAAQGYAGAEERIGSLYRDGLGVQQDGAQAVAWYLKAAQQGDVDAEYNLGYCYENGLGVPLDYAASVGWYQKAAAQGDVEAEVITGWAYDAGRGVNPDYVQAMSWYKKAANRGNALAQYNIGMLYENGHGVSQNHETALVWIKKAAANGYKDASDYLAGTSTGSSDGVDDTMNHWISIESDEDLEYYWCISKESDGYWVDLKIYNTSDTDGYKVEVTPTIYCGDWSETMDEKDYTIHRDDVKLSFPFHDFGPFDKKPTAISINESWTAWYDY